MAVATERSAAAEGRPGILVPALLLFALAALLVPVALVRIPPVLDYPNHMARLWLVAGNIAVPPMSEIYALDWSRAVVNSGMDMVAWLIGPLLGGEMVARLMLGLSLVLPPAGAAVLARTMSGRWPWTVLLLPLLAWNQVFTAGFLSLQIGIGLACFAASGAIVLQRRAPRSLVPACATAAALITVMHPIAAVFLAGLLGAERLWDDRRHHWDIRGAVRAAAPAALGTLIVLLLSPVPPGQESASTSWIMPAYAGLASRAFALIGPFFSHSVVTEGIPLLGLALLLGYAVIRSQIGLHRGYAAAATVLAATAALGPANLGDTGSLDIRLAGMAVLVFVVGLRPPAVSRRVQAGLASALFAATLVRTVWIVDLWYQAEHDADAVRIALTGVPAGAAILPVGPRPIDWNAIPAWRRSTVTVAYGNLPLLAIPERQAFVPWLFTGAGKQPIRVLPPWNEIAVPDGLLPEPRHLSDRSATVLRFAPYLADWPNRFDYVLVLNADQGADPLPSNLQLVRDAGFAQLWRVLRDGVPTASRPAIGN
ncbi:hypothetical protein [Falsiroseomonas oryziterrae]|uniref:hypothetical protein n=1 Tax=Falsiroseomonas oryziterrae TaxID=2911368 RepID=UPI001F362A24|nr:hypothetical protein [Roseomonas sp. NPKOSM-4]